MENAKTYFKNEITYSKNSYEALQDADCLLLLTEWSEFINPDFEKIKKIMKTPIIFDGRNQYNKERLNEFGFEYFRIGRR
jgi:UDPglucose 6-dehydrogenase